MASSGKLRPLNLPFHTSQPYPVVHLDRIHTLLYTIAILALFYHRFSQLCSSTTTFTGVLTSCLFFSDFILAIMWVLAQAFRWRPIIRRVYPERLKGEQLPSLDVFVCTADPYKEPPMGVVNTVLSVMAYDYPTEKLSVYVSDDGGSELTLYAMIEAAKYAKHWLPFCRENSVEQRSPEAYFRSNEGKLSGKSKILYEKMRVKVEAVMDKGRVDDDDLLILNEEERLVLKKWNSGFTCQEHPSVIQVLLENWKDMDISGHPLPNLIYVSREKRKDSPHHFKAGALNVLLRVSSVMTNAPFLVTLDCDMTSNDPTTPNKAMCFLLDDDMAGNLAFVQFPQRFRGINDSDIYGSEFRQLFLINPLGLDGIRGPNYVGTNTFFRRGALQPYQTPHRRRSISSDEVLDMSREVSEVRYEQGTNWGSTMGFRYGSLVEDFYTGYLLQCEGWISVFFDQERPAFVGHSPVTLHEALSQVRRWVVGLLEVGFSKHNPVTFGFRRGSLLFAMCYTQYAFWGLSSIPIVCYGVLPQTALVHQMLLFPKGSDPWFWLYIYLFLASYLQDLIEFLSRGTTPTTIGRWWNNQRMWLTRGVTSFPLGILDYLTKQTRLSTRVGGFNVTSKLTNDDSDQKKVYEKGLFNFGVESPFVVSLGFFATTNLVGLTVGFSRAFWSGKVWDFGLQILICGFAVLNCLPVYEALVVRKDCGRIPWKCGKISVLMTFTLYFVTYIMLSTP